MTVHTLATRTDLSTYTMRTVMDGREYLVALQWVERAGHWYLDLRTSSGVLLRAGAKLIVGSPLLRFLRSPLAPPGELFVLDRSRSGTPPGLHDLGDSARCILVYIDAVDL